LQKNNRFCEPILLNLRVKHTKSFFNEMNKNVKFKTKTIVSGMIRTTSQVANSENVYFLIRYRIQQVTV
jgi:hypothetical protein